MQVSLPSHAAPSPALRAPSPRRGEGDELCFSPSAEGRPRFFPLAPIGERVPEGRVRGRAIRATEPQHRNFAPELNQAQLSTGPGRRWGDSSGQARHDRLRRAWRGFKLFQDERDSRRDSYIG
jgi:hypothetical protein